MSLGTRIIAARTKKSLTQEQLAEMAGISLRTIQRIEKDQVKPQFYSLERLKEALGVSLDELSPEEPKLPRMIGLTLLSTIFIVIPILGNVVIPLFIYYLSSKTERDRFLFGKILSLQVLWTVLLIAACILAFNLSIFIWGTSNPGNFSPLLTCFTLMWVANLVMILWVLDIIRKGAEQRLEKIPSFI